MPGLSLSARPTLRDRLTAVGTPGLGSGRGSRKAAAPLTTFYSSFQQALVKGSWGSGQEGTWCGESAAGKLSEKGREL